MPLSRASRFGLALANPGALTSYDLRQDELAQQREQFDFTRMEKRNEQIVKAALDILKRAPKGSPARALAVASLNNAGFGNNAIIQAIQETGPAATGKPFTLSPSETRFSAEGEEIASLPAAPPTVPTSVVERLIKDVAKSPEEAEAMKRAYVQKQVERAPTKRDTKVVGGQLIDIPPEGGVEVLHTAPEPTPQDPSSTIERMIDRVAKTPAEAEQMRRAYIQTQSLPDPMRIILGRMLLGEGAGVGLPELSELTQDEQATAQNARSAMERGAPSEKIFEELKTKLGWNRQKFNKYVLGR